MGSTAATTGAKRARGAEATATVGPTAATTGVKRVVDKWPFPARSRFLLSIRRLTNKLLN